MVSYSRCDKVICSHRILLTSCDIHVCVHVRYVCVFVCMFRYSSDMEANPLFSNSRSVAALYLDNTYCDPSCIFPTRVSA